MKNLIIVLLLSSSFLMAQDKPAPAAVPSNTVAASPNAPVMEFEKTTHDFGTVKKGSPVTYKFMYKNTGKEPLLITQCKAGCGCTTPMCSKEPLKPGKTAFIEVHYDSMRVGVFTKEILVTSNARNGILTLVIKGNIVAEAEGGDLKQEPAPAVLPNKHNE